MKRIGVIIMALLCFSFVNSECDQEAAKKLCMKKLETGYIVIKSYNLSRKSEFNSYIFSKGIEYMITTHSNLTNNENIEVKIYDKNKKLILSNYNKKKNQFFKVLYPSAYTGVHYVEFVDRSVTKEVCGAGLLAFKR